MPFRGGTIINIAGTTPVDDPEYRYRMPAVFGKIEGSGNGIKTAIPNISDVALSLHRSPGEVNKFFGCELGAQTTYNEDTDRAIVNGAHTDATLQKLMHRYIEGFVICPTCGLVRIISRRFFRTVLGSCEVKTYENCSRRFLSVDVDSIVNFSLLFENEIAGNQVQYQEWVHLAQMCCLRCQRNGRHEP